MKVLVTGGAGFIGSHVVDILLEKGYDVIVVDNLSTGKKQNINKKARFYQVDITSEDLKKVFEKENPDFVCHHAAQINVRHSVKDPIFDAKTNIIGTINLLELCREYKVKKIVYASSGGAIYGNPKYLPCDEKHRIAPVSPYGVSKFAAEIYLDYYFHTFGLNYCSLRYANVYGPRQDPKGEAGVVAIFTNNFLENKECIIFGDGSQTRDFVYVGDVAKANLLALKNKCNACTINIGCSKEISINELYEKIRNMVDSDRPALYGSAIKGEVNKISLDIKLAKKILGWKPEFDLDRGLKQTIVAEKK